MFIVLVTDYASMSWVNPDDLDEYLSALSDPPTEFVRDEYTDAVTFRLDDVELDTTIIASENWVDMSERPTVNVSTEDRKTDVLDADLEALATILAYQQDGTTELGADESVDDYMWNGLTYVLDEPVDFSTTPTLTLRESDFYSVVSHTSRLVGDVLTDTHDTVRSERRNLFDTTGSLARNIDSYYRPLGGTYLTVVLDDDGTYYLLLGNRSDKVVLWPKLLTAFPAGYFKPNDISYGDAIDKHLLGEYSKEAMDVDLQTQSKNTSKGVNAITQLLRADKASFDVTGFGIEGFTVAAELTGVLLIEYPEYTEYLFENLEESYDVSHVTAIPIQESTREKFKRIFEEGRMTPQTAFALGTGLQYLDRHTDVPVPFEVETLFE